MRKEAEESSILLLLSECEFLSLWWESRVQKSRKFWESVERVGSGKRDKWEFQIGEKGKEREGKGCSKVLCADE